MLSLVIFSIIILIIGAYVRQINKGSQGDLKTRLGVGQAAPIQFRLKKCSRDSVHQL